MTDKLTSECSDCPVGTSRRAFLRQTGLAVAAAVTAASLAAPSSAFAEVIGTIAPTGARGRRLTYPMPMTAGVTVDDDNDVILARWQRKVYAFSQRCPHKGAQLEWRVDEQRVFCPKHKARFDAGGAHVSGRRSRDLDRYDVTRDGQTIVVDTATVRRADEDAAAWKAAVVSV